MSKWGHCLMDVDSDDDLYDHSTLMTDKIGYFWLIETTNKVRGSSNSSSGMSGSK